MASIKPMDGPHLSPSKAAGRKASDDCGYEFQGWICKDRRHAGARILVNRCSGQPTRARIRSKWSSVTVTISVKPFAKHNSMMPANIVSVASCTEPAPLPSPTQVSAQKRELSIIAECASSCPFGRSEGKTSVIVVGQASEAASRTCHFPAVGNCEDVGWR